MAAASACAVDLGANRVTFSQTKTNRPRSVPLTTLAQDAIRRPMPAVRSQRVWPYSYNQSANLVARAQAAIGLADDPAFCLHT